ncbi:Na+/H+ antiporter NhaA [Pseudoroseicyclus aestuarii]|uniref:Na(+)/H(+) antiporter NhaA n=1 Tax=Pseudoroseicyclus aestuarii TaxID=1795041 RepID=A0A318SU30_9RHOB|nr:Na+/H+ antiporter NhaA [Pseudoroseicyclus aestuarii]PYE83746.1 sodium/proton antiporter (NhaA family) [Pseudoroseicyclus aestuarii]
MYRVWNFITTYSLLLIAGTLIALLWANIDATSYHHFVDFPLIDHFPIGHAHYDESGAVTYRTLTVHYLINDGLMAFFFAIAAKEVWEAIILKDGSLRGKKAATPLVGTLGGMIGPIAVYLGVAAIFGSTTFDAVSRGWAIPTATDIAFSYLVGRMVFGVGHPAIRFLLLLAIADDAAGLIILAVFYPSGDLQPLWLLLSFGAALGVFALFNALPRRLDRHKPERPNSTWVREKLSFWPYLLAGCASWYGFQQAGIHPALGLLPIVPTVPHADRAFGIFSHAESMLTDLLNDIEHKLSHPVEVILFFFGLVNAGVEFNSIGSPTWLVVGALLVGKPVGILFFGWLAAGPMKLGLPEGMRTVDLLVIGCVASIGFTVSLFIASVAFDSSAMLGDIPVQDAAKMGALFSFAGAILAFIAGKLARVEKQHG